MKVYELMNRLEKANAGDEVVVNQTATEATSIEWVGLEDGLVTITGGDGEIIDDNGNHIGKLSYHASVDDDDEDDD